MNYKEAQILVKQPKWVVEESGDIVKTLTMEQRFPMRFRLRLVSALDPNKDLPHGFIGAFNSFVRYLNIQTELQINPMVL